jgi:lactoylglutathione lyase
MSSIHHVNLAVDDLASATVFYRDVLGLEPVPTPDLGFPAQFFSIGPGQELHVNQLDDIHADRTHFCLRLDDFAGVVERAEASAAIDTAAWGPATRIGTGVVQLFVRDPAGNLIELNSQPGERFEDHFYERSFFDPACER